MAKTGADSQFNQDKFTRIFDEYRAKIDEITRHTGHNLHPRPTKPPDDEPADTPAEETPRPEAGIAPETFDTRPEGDVSPAGEVDEVTEAEPPPATESAKIIRDARKQARQIITRAEAQVKKEARGKTRAQVDKLLARARKEAEDIISQARQAAGKERDAALAVTRREAEDMLREITEPCRQETRLQSSRILEEARHKAENLMAEVIAGSADISRLVKEITGRARHTVDELESRMRTETGELARIVAETQLKIERVTLAAAEEAAAAIPEPAGEPGDPNGRPTLAVRVLGERSNGRNGIRPLFFGRIEMKSESASFDYQYFKNLKKYFVKIPGIRHLQESASEQEISALFDITEPLPLLELLDKMPQVDEVISETDRNISVVFKQSR